MTFRNRFYHIAHLAHAVRAKHFAHGTFFTATVMDLAGFEQLRSMILVLYAAAWLTDHIG